MIQNFIEEMLERQADPNQLNQDGYLDVELAEMTLGRSLGFWGPEITYLDIKWVFWCANKTGDNLYAMLELMRDAGFLEVVAEGVRVKTVRPQFKSKVSC